MQRYSAKQGHGDQAELGRRRRGSASCATASVCAPSRLAGEARCSRGRKLPGPDAEQRVVGGEPGRRAPRLEPRRDVLLRDVLLEHQRTVERAPGCCGSRARSPRPRRPPRRAVTCSRRRSVSTKSRKPAAEPDERAAREAEQDRRRDQSDHRRQERPQLSRRLRSSQNMSGSEVASMNAKSFGLP